MNNKFFYVTNKELGYTAVMMGVSQLTNIVYNFPDDDAEFDAEMRDVQKSLRRKLLFKENSRGEGNLAFPLMLCAAFCSEPEECEIVEAGDYYATIYTAFKRYMLLERRSEEDLAATFFFEKENLDVYIKEILSIRAEGTPG